MIPRVMLFILFSVCSVHLHAQPADTSWRQRSEIKAIREIVNELDTAISTHRLVSYDTTFYCNDSAVVETATVYSDTHQVIRRLQLHGGTGDHAQTTIYNYDARGKLRFTFRTYRDVGGTHLEERVYLDEADSTIYRDVRQLAPVGRPWSGVYLIYSPGDYLLSPCE